MDVSLSDVYLPLLGRKITEEWSPHAFVPTPHPVGDLELQLGQVSPSCCRHHSMLPIEYRALHNVNGVHEERVLTQALRA